MSCNSIVAIVCGSLAMAFYMVSSFLGFHLTQYSLPPPPPPPHPSPPLPFALRYFFQCHLALRELNLFWT